MEDCIFCKIIENKISSEKVYEDKNTIAFLDISPVNKGHVLVLPKKHSVNLLDVSDNVLKELIIAVKKISKAVMQATGCEGINIGINNFKAAGQLVMHLHVHVIPRFSNDALKHWPGKKYEGNEEKEIAKEIRNQLNKN